jgi:hypothetical protein
MRKGAKFIRPDRRGKQYAPVATNLHCCLTDFCRRTVDKKKEHSPFCWKCRFRIRKEKNPLRYFWSSMRRTAKKRGKLFALPFEDYKRLAEKANYAELKGKSSMSLSIDRVENSLGYWPWNVQCITIRQNSRKEYVNYYQNQLGIVPEEVRHLDNVFTDDCEKIAAEVGKAHTPGSVPFWNEFRRRKADLLKSEMY